MAEDDLSGINVPCNIDAEQSVLGAVLMDSSAMSELATVLQPDHFYVALNRSVYGVMLNMYLAGDKIDIVTVLDAVMRQNIFETPEQAKEYLARIMTAVPSISTVGKYAAIVVDKYMARSLIFASKDIIDAVNEGTEDANTLIDLAEQKIFDIRSGAEIKGLTHIGGIVLDRIKALDELYKAAKEGKGQTITGLSTLYMDLDRRIYGLNRSDLIILAARPGMGKTSFAMNIVTNVGKKYQDTSIAVFSLEMSKEQIVSRMISSEASLTSDAMKTGAIPPEKWKDIGRASDVLSRLNIYIDDTPALSPLELRARTRRLKAESGVGLVMVDYLQLMRGSKRTDSREQEISEISRSLKGLAKEMDISVVALSQLNRKLEERTDKRPLLSDLRESGAIEQDADVIMFIYRDEVYHKQPDNPHKGSAEIIIGKQRNGPIGTATLAYLGSYTAFEDLEPGLSPQPSEAGGE